MSETLQLITAVLLLAIFIMQFFIIFQTNIDFRRLQSSPEKISKMTPEKKNKQHLPTLRSVYMSYNYVEGFHRWLEYTDAYERNIGRKRYLQKNIKLLEIGVQSGGSINIWKDYFGESLYYVGIDINKNCKQFEKLDRHIYVEIGTQSDSNFLSSICAKYGPFDVIIDDGSHITEDILITLRTLFTRCLTNHGVYVIEDLHWSSHVCKGQSSMTVQGKDVYGHFADIARDMSAYFKIGMATLSDFNLTKISPFSGHITRLEFYDSMIFLHYSKSLQSPLTEFKRGQVFIP